ncbi:MAG TPA: nitric-oxide reductase large subunit, partial [Rhodanobacteraceae bacterium]
MSTVSDALLGDEGPVSPWWLRTLGIVMVVGFGLLLMITVLAYRNAPPIPDRVADAQGNTVYTGDDIRDGQAVFLRYGLMDNGSIWGHGAYLGPDYSALALHRMGLDTAAALAMQRFGKPLDQLDDVQRAGVRAQAAVLLKTNRYDPVTRTLTLTAPEANAYRQQIGYWTDYFKKSSLNGGLKPDLITDPMELRQFTAFVDWAAWVSVANRPGDDFSYTNNFPYDPSVGNIATSGSLLWSALSLVVLLGGIATVLLIFGRFEHLGWVSGAHVHPQVLPGAPSPAQRALVKYFVVVAILFLAQTLLGGAVAHSRAEPGDFYGFKIDSILPSNLLRTWHLQTAIFWIATAYVAAALFLGRTLRRDEPRALTAWVNLLFVAFAIVIFGSLIGEWLGMSGLLGKAWFWVGDQGWEYLEIGRLWQALMIVGLFAWFAMLWWLVRPKQVGEQARPLSRMFLIAALAIPMFYIPALFYGAKTNYTVVDMWRFWIIHLWVEGFFELFATTIV